MRYNKEYHVRYSRWDKQGILDEIQQGISCNKVF